MIDLLQAFTLLALAIAALLIALTVRRMQREIRQMRNGEFVITAPANNGTDIIERINNLQDTFHRASRTPINVAKAKA